MTDPMSSLKLSFTSLFFNEPLLILLLSKSQKLTIRNQSFTLSIFNFEFFLPIHFIFKVDETKKANKVAKEYDFAFKRAPSWYTLNSLLRRKSCCEKLLF